MRTKLQAFLRLTRPANLLTAVSDIWAGAALAGFFLIVNQAILPLILLSLSSVFLYAGGVAMNDVCDAELDARERPERPIPSGIISKKAALVFACILFVFGIIFAGMVNKQSCLLALLIALTCIIYDRWGKPHVFFGPLTMGICRGLNLLLGMSILSLQNAGMYWLAVVPVIYIAAITLISRGEVHGGNRSVLRTALALYILVVFAIGGVAVGMASLLKTIVFLLLFILFIFPPLFKAIRSLTGQHIGKAVKSGVLGLILMNACWVAASGAGWIWVVVTALLLPLSIGIARRFAVT